LKEFFVSFNIFSHTKLGDPITGEDQVVWKVSKNPSLSIQRGMKQNGIVPKFSSSSKCKRMGLWSKVSFGRILEEMDLLSCRNELWTKNLSRRDEIWSSPNMLLV
jgi:hypothetical protein